MIDIFSSFAKKRGKSACYFLSLYKGIKYGFHLKEILPNTHSLKQKISISCYFASPSYCARAEHVIDGHFLKPSANRLVAGVQGCMSKTQSDHSPSLVASSPQPLLEHLLTIGHGGQSAIDRHRRCGGSRWLTDMAESWRTNCLRLLRR